MAERDKFLKEHLFKTMELYMDKTAEIINVMSESTLGEIQLPNIGITLNNTMVRIVSLYREKGLSFYSSNLYGVITTYLIHTLSDAIESINGYTDYIQRETNRLIPRNPNRIIEKSKDYIKRYKELNEKIFRFDLEKEIQEAVDFNINHFNKIGEEGGYNLYVDEPEIIEDYNLELKKLGFNIQLNKRANLDGQAQQIMGENENLNSLKNIAFLKIEEIELALKDSNLPHITGSLKDQILDFLEEAIESHNLGDFDKYQTLVSRIKNFNVSSEIMESVGKYIAYWNDVYTFHDTNIFLEVKAELEKFGYADAVQTVFNDVKNNKYADYVQKRNENFKEYTGNLLKQTEEAVTQQKKIDS